MRNVLFTSRPEACCSDKATAQMTSQQKACALIAGERQQAMAHCVSFLSLPVTPTGTLSKIHGG